MGWGNRSEHRHIYDYEADMFSGVTTYHGMVRIYNSRSCLGRTFWMLVVFVAFLLFVLQAVQLLYQYRDKPTMTQIDFVVPKSGMPFPAVTICNFNPIMSSRIEPWNMSAEVRDYVMMAFLQPYDLSQMNESYVRDLDALFIEYADNYSLNNNNTEFKFRNFYRDAGFTCSDMFLECSFGSEPFDCCNENVTTELLTDYGKCFQFALGHHLEKLPQRGQSRFMAQTIGLEFLIDVHTPEQPDFFVADIFDSGIRFNTHDDRIPPLISMDSLAIEPGFKAYAAVALRNITLLPEQDWGMCRDNWDGLPIPVLDSFRAHPYSNEDCMKNCLVNVYNEQCGCVPVRYQVENLDVCTPFQLLNCTKEVVVQAIWQTFWLQTCGCGVECNRLDFDTTMSYSKIPNIQAMKQLTQKYNRNESYIRENYLMLSLYMKQIYFERHEQTKTLNQYAVLSQIGGCMGLCMGMSIITLAEIFVFLAKTIYGMVYGNRKAINDLKKELEMQEAEYTNFAYESDYSDYDTIYNDPEWFTDRPALRKKSSMPPQALAYVDVPVRTRSRANATMHMPVIIEGPQQNAFRNRGYTRVISI